MKTLLLIRHAKSSWADPGQEDFERPLNDRGKQDAPVMGKRFAKKGIQLDAIIASPAKRTKKTSELIAGELGVDKSMIFFNEDLYLAPVSTFYDIISNIDDVLDHVAIIAHNPGITDFVNELTGVRVDNMPTCAVYGVQIKISRWGDFKKEDKRFLFFDYPKNT